MGMWCICAIKRVQGRLWEGVETGDLRKRPHNILWEGASLRRDVMGRKGARVNTRVQNC